MDVPAKKTEIDAPTQPAHDEPTPTLRDKSKDAMFVRRSPLSSFPIEWGQIDPRACVHLSMELYATNLGHLLIAHLLYVVCMLSSTFLLNSLAASGQQTLASVFQLIAMAFIVYINVGLFLLALTVARHQPIATGILFSGGDRVFRVLIFNVLYAILTFIGCIGFIVPGVYIASRFWSGGLFIIDQNCSVFEAFGYAGRFSEGNRLPSLMLGLLSLGLAAFGLSLFGVGLIVVYPLITLIWTVAYLMMTRQPIQRPVPPSPAPAA